MALRYCLPIAALAVSHAEPPGPPRGNRNGNPTTNVNIYPGKSILVDSVKGNDPRAARESLDRPFLTIGAALAAASNGDTLEIGPGGYVEGSIVKNGVNLHLAPGAVVSYNRPNAIGKGILDDFNGAATAIVDGGSFIYTTPSFGMSGAIYLSNPSSYFQVSATLVRNGSAVGDEGAAVWQGGGRLDLTANTINSSQCQSTIAWYDGDMKIRGGLITADLASSVFYGVCPTAAPTGKAWVDIQEWKTPGQLVVIVPETSAQVTSQIYLLGNEMRSEGATNDPANLIQDSKVYYTFQKLSYGSASQYLFKVDAGKAWVTTQKLGGLILDLNGGSVNLSTLDWLDDTGSTTYMMDVSGGELTVHGGRFKAATSNGLRITGGKVRLVGCTIDMSAVAGSNPITITGGTLILQNCTLIAHGGRDSIETGGGAVSVAASGSFANTAVDPNVTIAITNGLTIDANVQ